MVNSENYTSCPLTNAMEILGGKWKIVIIGHLFTGAKRNGEFLRLMSGITQKMLTQQLRELEKDNIVNRKIFNQVPPKVEYSLTEYGKTLEPILVTLCEWGNELIKSKQDEIKTA